MSFLNFNITANPTSPPANGQLELFAGNDKFLHFEDDTGTVRNPMVAYNPITAATSGINTAETILVQSSVMPANMWQVGTTFRVTLLGTCTSTVANLSTFTVRFGTAGTTSDAAIATATVTAVTSGTNVPFKVELEFTVRTNGTSGTLAGSLTCLNSGTTGIAAANITVVPLTPAALNSTTANFLSITYKTAATTTTSTFQNAYIEIVKI